MPDSPALTTPAPRWLRLHMLSLEAPIVAVAWTAALAALHRVSVMPGVLAGLALSVWIIYVLDRLLDCVGKKGAELGLRHEFHQRLRVVLLVLVGLAAFRVAWLALWIVPGELMRGCAVLAVPVFFYLGVFCEGMSRVFFRWVLPLIGLLAAIWIAFSDQKTGYKLSEVALIVSVLLVLSIRRNQDWLRSALGKDVMGGMLFALGCTAWSRFINSGADPVGGFVEFVLLACLFTANLSGISSPQSHTRWLAAGFGSLGGMVALVLRGHLADSMLSLAGCSLVGFLLLAFLHAQRARLSADLYRVLADAAVLIPAVLLLLTQ